jgi:outer membrane biosynthesis protein TonB
VLSQQFEIENHRKETKNRLSGVVVSIAVHALLLLCLYFTILTTINPPMEDNQGGMTVNYGTSDVGTGDQQQFTTVPVTVQQETAPTPVSQPTASSSPEDLETQNTEDAPVVEKKTEVKKQKVKPNPDAMFKPQAKPVATTAPQPPTPKADPNALFSPGALGKPNKSKGDGEGGGQGDQGDPNGDPNSRNYHGGGTGNGPGRGGDGLGGDKNVSLRGRHIKAKPKFSYDCDAKGTVVMTIKVSKTGRVTNADFRQQGSTSEDDCLINRARQLALEYTFDENSTAADLQIGSITFSFKEH